MNDDFEKDQNEQPLNEETPNEHNLNEQPLNEKTPNEEIQNEDVSNESFENEQQEIIDELEQTPFSQQEDNKTVSSNSFQWNEESYKKVTKKPKHSKALKIFAITTAVVVFIGIIGVTIFGTSRLIQEMRKRINNTGTGNSSNITDQSSNVSNVPPIANEGDVLTVPQIYAKVSPSVVSIIVGNSGLGSGMIISADGYVLTNAHVVSNSQSLKVVTTTNKEYDAVIKGIDSRTDLAILKIEASGLPAVELGDSSKILVGEDVVAIGSPYDIELATTITNGIVSAYRKNIAIGDYITDLIQTNTDINPGNSGGPLVNSYGQVIGITSSKIMGETQGLGFAIPINITKPIIESLINDGYVKGRPMLGISGEFYTTRNGEPFGYIFVTYVNPDSDVANKGLEKGDLIISINDKEIESFQQFTAEKEKFKVGDSIKIDYLRKGKSYSINVILSEAKPTQ